ncbi:MAG: hypothetical protein MK098_02255 [Marinovum sp.]|nr:hypothetical protein [Marinovum sp.]
MRWASGKVGGNLASWMMWCHKVERLSPAGSTLTLDVGALGGPIVAKWFLLFAWWFDSSRPFVGIGKSLLGFVFFFLLAFAGIIIDQTTHRVLGRPEGYPQHPFGIATTFVMFPALVLVMYPSLAWLRVHFRRLFGMDPMPKPTTEDASTILVDAKPRNQVVARPLGWRILPWCFDAQSAGWGAFKSVYGLAFVAWCGFGFISFWGPFATLGDVVQAILADPLVMIYAAAVGWFAYVAGFWFYFYVRPWLGIDYVKQK